MQSQRQGCLWHPPHQKPSGTSGQPLASSAGQAQAGAACRIVARGKHEADRHHAAGVGQERQIGVLGLGLGKWVEGALEQVATDGDLRAAGWRGMGRHVGSAGGNSLNLRAKAARV